MRKERFQINTAFSLGYFFADLELNKSVKTNPSPSVSFVGIKENGWKENILIGIYGTLKNRFATTLHLYQMFWQSKMSNIEYPISEKTKT